MRKLECVPAASHTHTRDLLTLPILLQSATQACCQCFSFCALSRQQFRVSGRFCPATLCPHSSLELFFRFCQNTERQTFGEVCIAAHFRSSVDRNFSDPIEENAMPIIPPCSSSAASSHQNSAHLSPPRARRHTVLCSTSASGETAYWSRNLAAAVSWFIRLVRFGFPLIVGPSLAAAADAGNRSDIDTQRNNPNEIETQVSSLSFNSRQQFHSCPHQYCCVHSHRHATQ